MQETIFQWEQSRQLTIPQLLLAIFIPSGVAFVGFRVVLPMVVSAGTPTLSGWATIASVMLFLFVPVAIYLLNREAKELGIPLTARMCLLKLTGKQWLIYGAMLVVAFVLAILSQPVTIAFMEAVDGFPPLTIPDYMPFMLDPRIDPMTADLATISPGLIIRGNYGLLPLVLITLFLNILTEELYFRAWMMPKLARYGNVGWVLNGTLFALYHTFQLWLFPTLLVASLAFAFIFYRSKSTWTVFAGHFIGNFLLAALGMVAVIAS